MKREIKFRAWDKNAIMMKDDGTHPNGQPHMKYDVGVMCSNAKNEWATGIDGLEVRVNSNKFILMQSTGLIDRENVTIFEDDVILKDQGIWRIVWAEGCFWCYNPDFNTAGQQFSWPDHCWPIFRADHTKRSTVIGNVWQNPRFEKFRAWNQ